MKLFREWFSQWSAENRENFLKQVSDIDPMFASKLKEELQNGIANNYATTNGVEDVLED